MRELLFYEKPVALNRELHKELSFSPLTNFNFSKQVNSVPVSGIEFFEASRDFPVLFNRDAEGNYYPLALLSLQQQHDWVDEKGVWQGNYVPAFIRRYPFALTADGTVCFDEVCEAFNGGSDALFNEEGQNSEVLERVVTFLNQYDAQAKITREYCNALAEKNLFKPFNLQIVGIGSNPLRLDGLYALDESEINKLAKDVVDEWFRKGWLAWSYAHLHSLGALQGLSRRLKASKAAA